MSNLTSSSSRGTRMLRVCCLIAACLLLLPINASFASGQQEDPDRTKAFQLFEDRKIDEALPLFEKLLKTYPNDPAVLERFGWLLFMRNDSIKDLEERKAARKRGRELLVRAKNAGADSPIVASMIEAVAQDGGDDSAFSFSKRKEVDDAMRAGEAAFMRKEFPKAVEFYQQALVLDPKMYEAALYIGDVYFSTAEQRKAAEWFARAVEIDPNRETAYRYWGDSLMKQTRVTEAGDKYVEAYIAEPYSRLANSGLGGWASKVGVELSHPKIEFPSNVSAQANGNSTISLDPSTFKKDDKSSAAWLTYSFARTTWIQGEFAKQYPEEKTYRHSLKEETTAIRTALKRLDVEKDAKTIDPSLAALAKLDREGLLEAYVLLAMADEGISKDFPTYRKEHVDKLREYVNKYVLTNGGKN